MADQQLAEFMIGATCAAFGYCVGIVHSRPSRDRDPDWRRSFNHENINRPQGPPPVRFEPGRVQRSNSGNPTTIKPAIVPKPQFPPARRIPSWQWPGDY